MLCIINERCFSFLKQFVRKAGAKGVVEGKTEGGFSMQDGVGRLEWFCPPEAAVFVLMGGKDEGLAQEAEHRCCSSFL